MSVSELAHDAPDDVQRCEGCYEYMTPHDDPNTLEYYVHLHLSPEEVVDALTVPALHKYLVAVLKEGWPDQLLLRYGVDHLRLTLRQATALHGHAFGDSDIKNPPGYFRWLLKQPPLMQERQENPFAD